MWPEICFIGNTQQQRTGLSSAEGSGPTRKKNHWRRKEY